MIYPLYWGNFSTSLCSLLNIACLFSQDETEEETETETEYDESVVAEDESFFEEERQSGDGEVMLRADNVFV